MPQTMRAKALRRLTLCDGHGAECGVTVAPASELLRVTWDGEGLMILSVWRGGELPRLPRMGPELGKRGSYSATYGPPETRTRTRPANAVNPLVRPLFWGGSHWPCCTCPSGAESWEERLPASAVILIDRVPSVRAARRSASCSEQPGPAIVLWVTWPLS
jgi:hypothetical protein